MLSVKTKIYLIASFFYIASCFCLYFNYKLNILLLAEISFLALYFRFKVYNEWALILFWLFFILSEIVFVFYNGSIKTLLPVILKLLGYIMLCISGFTKQKPLGVKRFEGLIYGLLILLNTYVVSAIISIIKPFVVLEYLVELYFCLGLTLIVLGAIAVRYWLIGDSKSKFFAFIVLFLTCSEIINVIAIYLNYKFLHYLGVLFFVFGLAFCVMFSVLENKNDKVFKLVKS